MKERGNSQWMVRGLNQNYNQDTNNEDWDPWYLKMDDNDEETALYDCVMNHYPNNLDLNLKITMKNNLKY